MLDFVRRDSIVGNFLSTLFSTNPASLMAFSLVTSHPATFFFSALNFAHRFLAAFPIFALAAADITRFLTTLSSLLVESPKAFAAARTPFNWCCSLPPSRGERRGL
jgi:hypothetical protein